VIVRGEDFVQEIDFVGDFEFSRESDVVDLSGDFEIEIVAIMELRRSEALKELMRAVLLSTRLQKPMSGVLMF
jgi:hypothetical protein